MLAEEPFCVGYPEGTHGRELVRTTQADHIDPVSRGGKSMRSNERGLCASCNGRKSLDDRVRSWRDR